MGEVTGIGWTDHTWSPWWGCTKVSVGDKGACVGCYARKPTLLLEFRDLLLSIARTYKPANTKPLDRAILEQRT